MMTSFYDTTSITMYMKDRQRDAVRSMKNIRASEVAGLRPRSLVRPIREAAGISLIRAGVWLSGTPVTTVRGARNGA